MRRISRPASRSFAPRSLPTLAALATLAGLAPVAAAQQTLPPPEYRDLARDLLRELVEINTTHSTGNTTVAAEAMAARLRAEGFAEGPRCWTAATRPTPCRSARRRTSTAGSCRTTTRRTSWRGCGPWPRRSTSPSRWTAPPPPSPPSPLTDEVPGPIQRITDEMWPGVPVLPIMSTGATDGLYLRREGIPVYGVSGLLHDVDDVRAHGQDERILAEHFYEGQEFLYRLVKSLSKREIS